MRETHPQSHVTHWSRGNVTNVKYFIFTFTRHKAHKLSRVVTRMRRPRPTCHVTPQSRRHVTSIQWVVRICSISSWSSLLKIDRFQMIMTTLKMCSLHKEVFMVSHYFLAGCLYGKNILIDDGSLNGIIYFCVYIKSVPSCQTRHMFINT